MPTPTPPVLVDGTNLKDAEAAFVRMKPLLDAVSEAGLDPLNVDLDRVGRTAFALAQKCVTPEVWGPLSTLPSEQFDAAARVQELADLALAASWVATQGLTVRAAQTEAQLPQTLVQEATALKVRMQATCEYCLDDDGAVRELASIRAGTGYDDLKHDLRRLAVLYRDRKADLGGPKFAAADEARALELADAINVRQRGVTPQAQTKLERALWKLLKKVGDRAYDAAYFVTDHVPLVRRGLQSIHTWRDRGGSSSATATAPSDSAGAPSPSTPTP